jgi:hypothetical protein
MAEETYAVPAGWQARLVNRWVILGRQVASKPVVTVPLLPFLLLAVVLFTLFDRNVRGYV